MERCHCGTGIPEDHRSYSCYKRRGSCHFIKTDTVIAWIRLCQLRIFSGSVPVKSAAFNNYPAKCGSMPSYKLSGRMHYNIRTIFKGSQQIWSGKCAVHYQNDLVPVCNIGDLLDINQIRVWIPDGLYDIAFVFS